VPTWGVGSPQGHRGSGPEEGARAFQDGLLRPPHHHAGRQRLRLLRVCRSSPHTRRFTSCTENPGLAFSEI